jgi:hypothetical protein
MPSFEEKIKEACDAREIPGVVLLAVDKTGISSIMSSLF